MKFAGFMFVLLLSLRGNSHPVSFQNSLGIMGQHSPDMTHNQINYSFKYWWALGAHHYKRIDGDDNRHASLVSSNFLLKRWYGDALQANIYGIVGAGESELLYDHESVGLGALQFDIEDRKYYFLTKYSQIFDSENKQLEQYTVRFGLAPYVGAYEDLHTWFILEWSEDSFLNEKPDGELTPMLRFFYRNVLFEIGQSFNGNSKFNYTIHY